MCMVDIYHCQKKHQVLQNKEKKRWRSYYNLFTPMLTIGIEQL